jgi:hypothetical protein
LEDALRKGPRESDSYNWLIDRERERRRGGKAGMPEVRDDITELSCEKHKVWCWLNTDPYFR